MKQMLTKDQQRRKSQTTLIKVICLSDFLMTLSESGIVTLCLLSKWSLIFEKRRRRVFSLKIHSNAMGLNDFNCK